MIFWQDIAKIKGASFMKYIFSIIKWYLLVISLVSIVACQGSLASYRGATVEPEERIALLEDGLQEGSLQTFDLTLEYQYERKADLLQLSGVAKLSSHYKDLYEILNYLSITVYFLDTDGKVMEGKLILNTPSIKLDDNFSFNHHLKTPPGTASITFGYMGAAGGGGESMGGASFSRVPRSSFF
jgi:hypothetical protein